jgi:ligand-binding sensor domain-containing protein
MKTSIFITSLFIIQCCTVNSQTLNVSNPSDSISVKRLICESKQYQWIGTDIGLLLRNIQTGKELLITRKKSALPSNKITCGVCLPDGRTYIGTTKGIAYCNNQTLVRIYSDNSDLPEDNIKCLRLDHQNNVWVKTIHDRVGMITGTSVTMLKKNYHHYYSEGKYFQSPFTESGTTLDSLNCDPVKFIR